MRILLVPIAVMSLAGCGGGIGLTGKSEDSPKEAVSLERPNTTENRLLQVASTSARASYCAFGMDRAKLKSDYLAYEQSQGATPETVDKLSSLYDSTYNLFYNKVRQNPSACSKQDIEDIRPQINRHLAGDFTPSARKPKPVEAADVDAPILKRDKRDIISGGVDNPIFSDPETAR